MSDDGHMLIGSIHLNYYLDETGRPYIEVDNPEFDVIPAVVQVGMVAFAQDQILRGPVE